MRENLSLFLFYHKIALKASKSPLKIERSVKKRMHKSKRSGINLTYGNNSVFEICGMRSVQRKRRVSGKRRVYKVSQMRVRLRYRFSAGRMSFAVHGQVFGRERFSVRRTRSRY